MVKRTPATADPIWRLMEERGQRLSWLARKAHLSVGHLCRVRAGRLPLTEQTKEKIASAYGERVEALFR